MKVNRLSAEVVDSFPVWNSKSRTGSMIAASLVVLSYTTYCAVFVVSSKNGFTSTALSTFELNFRTLFP